MGLIMLTIRPQIGYKLIKNIRAMSKLLNQKVQCTERSVEIGTICYYDPNNGEMNVRFSEDDVLITHISKCKIVK